MVLVDEPTEQVPPSDLVRVDRDRLPGRCEGLGKPVQWSPNDEWIVAQLAPGGPAVILDADGSTQDQPSWLTDGAETWQRVAP